MNAERFTELSGGPVLVNGEAPGEVWRTANACGSWEVIHIWGNTEIVEVRGAWLQRDGETITVGPLFEQPIVDGGRRKGYFSPRLSGTIDEKFPQYIQHFAARESLNTRDGDVWRTRHATVVFNKQTMDPLGVYCGQLDCSGGKFSLLGFEAMF